MNNDWTSTRLGNVAFIEMGQSPPGNSYNTDSDGLPLINGPTEFTKRHPIVKQWTNKPTKLCKKGDILLCVRGSSTGRMNISNGVFCIGRGVAAIRGKNNYATTEFLEQILVYNIQKILSKTTGSTFPNIDKKTLNKIELFLPNISIQKQIQEVLIAWDEAIELVEELIEKNKKLKKSLLQNLIEFSSHPTTSVSSVISESLTGEYGTDPELGCPENYSMLPLLRSTNYTNEGWIDYKSVIERCIPNNKLEKVVLQKGDILLEKSGGSPTQPVGRVVFFGSNKQYGFVNFLQRLTVNKKFNSMYIFYALKQYYESKKVLRYQQQTTGIINFQLNDFLKTAKIKVPENTRDQERIADTIYSVDIKIQLLIKKKKLLKKQKNGLMSILLSGKVTVS